MSWSISSSPAERNFFSASAIDEASLLVINALMLWLAASIVPGVKVKGFGPAFLGALLLSVFNVVVSWLPGLS